MRVGGQGYGSLTILPPPTHYSAIFRLQTIMQIHNEQLLCDKCSAQTVFVCARQTQSGSAGLLLKYYPLINPLLHISFASILSHSIGCFFIFLMVSFTVQKLFRMMQSHLFIFAFFALTGGDRSKKILLRPMSKSFLLWVLWFQVLYSSL